MVTQYFLCMFLKDIVLSNFTILVRVQYAVLNREKHRTLMMCECVTAAEQAFPSTMQFSNAVQ